MGFNFANMLKQAQMVQKRLQDAQKDLAESEITAQAGNGAVTVVCDGLGSFKSLKLKKEAISAENPSSVDDETVEMLEELITSALKQATAEATQKKNDKMKGIVPAGVNIPGLF